MAITTLSLPDTPTPAYNPIWFVVSSSNKNEANFEYICDVYIDGVTFASGASYLRLKTPADPVYGRGIFNLSDILQRQLTSDIGDTQYGFQQCSNSILKYTAKFGELYGPSSGVVAYTNLTNTENYYAFNGCFSVLDWKDYVSLDYTEITGPGQTDAHLLTNSPSSGTIRSDESQWLYVLPVTSGAIKFANVNIYAHVGNSKVFQGAYRIINHQYFDTATTANRMLRFPIGYNITNIAAGNVYSQSVFPDGLLSAAIKSWEIYFTDSNHNRITDSYWVYKDSECTNHNEYRLHFKNKLGGFDSFTFTRGSQTTSDTNRNSYEKVMGEMKSSTSYTYNKTDRFQTNFHTRYKHIIKLNSDWVNETQSVWLEELLTSPEIYVQDETHGNIPVSIIDTKYVQRKHITDKIFNLTIDIQYTFNEIRQGA